MNVLDHVPKSAQPAAHNALAQIRDAEDRNAQKAVNDCAAAYGAKHSKDSDGGACGLRAEPHAH